MCECGIPQRSRDKTYALVRQHRGAVDVQLVLDGDIVAENGNVLDTALRNTLALSLLQDPRFTHPAADSAVPSNNGRRDPGVVANGGVGQNDATLETDTLANLDTGADNNVGANESGGVDLSGLLVSN